MANTCSICDDSRRADIDKALQVPRSDSQVSRQFGFSRATIARHRAHSALNSLIDAHKEGAAGEIQRLKGLAELELKSNDPKIRLAAASQLKGLVELEIRAKGQEADSAYLYKHPSFQDFLTHLLQCLCGTCKTKVLEHGDVGDVAGGGDTRTE